MGRSGVVFPFNFPPGWDEERVQRLLRHYDSFSEEEALAEDEAAFEDATQTVMEAPKELVPAVRALIAERATPAASGFGESCNRTV